MMLPEMEVRARLIVLATTTLLVATQIQIASPAAAQGGAVGGTIGKQGRSLSGDQGTTRESEKATSRRAKVQGRPEASAGRSLSGLWRWTGQCARYAEPYVGTVTLAHSGNTLTGSHGGTNMWDRGDISNGSVSGNRVSFDRTFGQYRDHVSLTLSGSGKGMRMSGVIPDTAHSGRCVMTFSKL
jgi:hypothetical protein